MKHFKYQISKLLLLSLFTGLVGCGGGGDDDDDGGNPPPAARVYTLNQAAYNGSTYAYGHNSTPSLKIINAPADTDYNRWAKLHDGGTWRLYFFKKGSNTTLYQFAYNSPAKGYEYGFNGAIQQLSIVGTPADANPAQFSMLHDGEDYRLYMQSKTNMKKLYQFAFNPSTQRYEYGHNSIASISVTGAPADTDFNRWAMLHDGARYRFYAFKQGSDTNFYQFAFNGASYAYGFNSVANLRVTGMPAESDTSSFAMNHDGSNYRFYFRQID